MPFTIQLSYAGTPAGTITYSAATDTITVVGANSTHPAEFLDLYNADVAGGWGQVTRQSTTQYSVACKIVIGNATTTTYFNDSNKQITFENGVISSWAYHIELKNNSYLQLGEPINPDYKTVKNGVDIYSLETDSGYLIFQTEAWDNQQAISLYGCSFRTLATSYIDVNHNAKIWGSYLGYAVGLIVSNSLGAGVDVTDVLSETKNAATASSLEVWANSNLTNFRHKGTGRVLYTKFGANFTVNECYARNYSILFADDRFTGNAHLKNFDVDTWSVTFQDNRSTGTVYRDYTFDLYVLNGALTDFVENANVTLTNGGSVVGSWLSNSTGQIATQTLNYGYYNYTGGTTMYGGTAWTLTITHPDWTTYTSVFYPYSQIEWSISMQDTSAADNNMVTIGLLLGGIAFLGIIVIRRKQS